MDSHIAKPSVAAAIAAAPAAPPEKPRRRRRWLIALGCLLVLLAIPVALYFYLGWRSERELQEVIAELDQADPNWRIHDLLASRPPIADEDNPSLVVLKVEALLGPGGYDVGQKNWRLFDEMTSERSLNGPQIVALRESFAQRGEALKLARSLKDFGGEGRYNIKIADDFLSTNLEPLQRCRAIMSLLQNDAMLRAEDDDGAGAVESCQACLAATRSIGQEPYLIAALIRFAGQAITVSAVERTLAQTEPPEPQLAAMQALLAKEIDVPVLVDAMRGERGGFDEMVRVLAAGKIKVSALTGPNSNLESRIVDWFPLVLASGRPEYLRLMSKTVAATKLPPEKQQQAIDEVETEVRESSTILVRLLMPAVTKVSQASRRTQAQLRCTMVALALERYRIKHGQWPATLEDLCKGPAPLLAAVPTDPCDGQPLRFKATADGVVVYSVGMDGVDNGGNLDRRNPIGPGVDLGLRLWDVPARRQAPLPPPPPEDDGGPPP